MKAFLDRLDRKAGRWLATLDGELQPPIVQVMTGEVFTHRSAHDHRTQPQPEARTVQPATASIPRRSTAECDAVCPPRLQNQTS